jgi:hypothetical protein
MGRTDVLDRIVQSPFVDEDHSRFILMAVEAISQAFLIHRYGSITPKIPQQRWRRSARTVAWISRSPRLTACGAKLLRLGEPALGTWSGCGRRGELNRAAGPAPRTTTRQHRGRCVDECRAVSVPVPPACSSSRFHSV